MMHVRQLTWYSILFCVIVCADRLSKALAIMYCQDSVAIAPFLSCDLTFNRGISWSMFHADAQLPFVIVSGVVLLVTLFLACYACRRYVQNHSIIGEVMVLAGSCSNCIDRLFYGGVADFIRIFYKDWSYPSFNCADAAIVIGVVYMIWEYYKE
jgi:signal peptidase II